MKKLSLFIIVLSLSVGCLASTQKDSLWNDAVNAYSGGDYEVALRSFSELEREGYVSSELYFNIGNCYYKLGNYTAKAILYYERTLRLDPSNPDAKINLELAHQYTLDRIDVVPEFVLVSWVKNFRDTLSSNMWAYISLSCFLLASLLLVVFRYGRSLGLRKASFIIAIVIFVMALCSLSFSISLYHEYQREDAAIVMNPVSSVRSSPTDTGKSLFIIHEGTKVQIIDSLGDWKRIELSDGRQGWLPYRDIEII